MIRIYKFELLFWNKRKPDAEKMLQIRTDSYSRTFVYSTYTFMETCRAILNYFHVSELVIKNKSYDCVPSCTYNYYVPPISIISEINTILLIF